MDTGKDGHRVWKLVLSDSLMVGVSLLTQWSLYRDLGRVLTASVKVVRTGCRLLKNSIRLIAMMVVLTDDGDGWYTGITTMNNDVINLKLYCSTLII